MHLNFKALLRACGLVVSQGMTEMAGMVGYIIPHLADLGSERSVHIICLDHSVICFYALQNYMCTK